ncbi:hypothetical protein [Salinicola sp. CPA57]|uniref:hypothetical protein n=1 Tax=Salinicola sp. CPA57 TaxID=1949080 RepID=UPI000DA186E1|nr:hypothetical protein [Salinicola sp. CPA57]
MIQYPEALPIPLLENYQLQDVDPLLRTPMESGTTRNRQRYISVPTDLQVAHLFSPEQYEMFCGWWVHIIKDGAIPYSARMRTATGLGPRKVQPTGVHQDSWLGRHWKVTYPVRVLTRDVPSEQRTLELIYDIAPLGDFVDRLDGVLSDYYTDSWLD